MYDTMVIGREPQTTKTKDDFMARFTNCLDCGKRFDQDKLGVFGPELCAKCLAAAEAENMHSDEAHDRGHEDPTCPVCMELGLVPDTRKPAKKGHGKGGGALTAPTEKRTRTEIIADMRGNGYKGPVSYVKKDLLEIEAAWTERMKDWEISDCPTN